VQESINVRARQHWRVWRHSEYWQTISDLDVYIDQSLQQALNENIDRLADLGRKHTNQSFLRDDR
jgi:hypothetical protein